MTSMPASRSARAMILAPRSWPSSPGLATTTRILRAVGAGDAIAPHSMSTRPERPCAARSDGEEDRRARHRGPRTEQSLDGDEAGEAPVVQARAHGVQAGAERAV